MSSISGAGGSDPYQQLRSVGRKGGSRNPTEATASKRPRLEIGAPILTQTTSKQLQGEVQSAEAVASGVMTRSMTARAERRERGGRSSDSREGSATRSGRKSGLLGRVKGWIEGKTKAVKAKKTAAAAKKAMKGKKVSVEEEANTEEGIVYADLVLPGEGESSGVQRRSGSSEETVYAEVKLPGSESESMLLEESGSHYADIDNLEDGSSAEAEIVPAPASRVDTTGLYARVTKKAHRTEAEKTETSSAAAVAKPVPKPRSSRQNIASGSRVSAVAASTSSAVEAVMNKPMPKPRTKFGKNAAPIAKQRAAQRPNTRSQVTSSAKKPEIVARPRTSSLPEVRVGGRVAALKQSLGIGGVGTGPITRSQSSDLQRPSVTKAGVAPLASSKPSIKSKPIETRRSGRVAALKASFEGAGSSSAPLLERGGRPGAVRKGPEGPSKGGAQRPPIGKRPQHLTQAPPRPSSRPDVRGRVGTVRQRPGQGPVRPLRGVSTLPEEERRRLGGGESPPPPVPPKDYP